MAQNFVALLGLAQAQVESSPLWKRFIEGTPLANDIAVWMANFVMEIAEKERAQSVDVEKVVALLDGNIRHVLSEVSKGAEPANLQDLATHAVCRLDGVQDEIRHALYGKKAARALSGEKAGPVGDEWNSRAAKLLRDLEFSALGGRRCPCCLGWNDQNGETDRQHTKDCELAALIATSPTPGKEG